jgi:O-antigen/teichoic acid export membrane protein
VTGVPEQPAPEPRHLGAGAALSVAAQVAPLGAAAILSVVLARAVGPSANGSYALIATSIGWLSLLFGLGLPAGITYRISRGTWVPADALRTSYLVAAALGAAAVPVGLVGYLLTEDTVFGGVPRAAAILGLASTPLVIAYSFASAIALGRDRYEVYAGLEMVHASAILFASAGLALAFGVVGAVAGLVVASLAAAVAGAWWLGRWTQGDEQRSDNRRELREASRFGVKAWAGNLLQQINYRLDVILLGAYAATSDVGVYSVAVTVTGLGWVLPQALQTVVFPRTAHLHAAAEEGRTSIDDADAAAARAVRHGVLLLVPTLVIVVFLLAVVVPLLYGSDFSDSTWLGLLLLPGVAGLGIAKILTAVFTGRGFASYALYAALFVAPVTIALYLVAIPWKEAAGAALASTASYLLTTLVTLYLFRRATAIPLRDALVPRAEDLRDYKTALELLRAHLKAKRSSRSSGMSR